MSEIKIKYAEFTNKVRRTVPEDPMNKDMTYEEYLRDVKKGIVTDLGNCPVTPLLVMLQGKWKTQILYELCIHDTVRFGLLKKELPGITNTMLTSSLRELEADGFINRVQFNEIPPHVEYSFTERGRDLMPIFYEIMRWGFKHENDVTPRMTRARTREE